VSALLPTCAAPRRGEVLEQAPLAAPHQRPCGRRAQLWVKPRDPDALLDVLGVLATPRSPGSRWAAARTPSSATAGVSGAVIRLGQDFASEEVEEAGDHVVLTTSPGAPIARFSPSSCVAQGARRGVAITLASPGRGNSRDGSAGSWP